MHSSILDKNFLQYLLFNSILTEMPALLQVLRRLPIFSVVGTPGKILRDNDFIMFVGQRRKKEGGKKYNTERTFIFLREL